MTPVSEASMLQLWKHFQFPPRAAGLCFYHLPSSSTSCACSGTMSSPGAEWVQETGPGLTCEITPKQSCVLQRTFCLFSVFENHFQNHPFWINQIFFLSCYPKMIECNLLLLLFFFPPNTMKKLFNVATMRILYILPAVCVQCCPL